MEVSDLWLPLVRTRPGLEGWILGGTVWMVKFWVVFGDVVFGTVEFCVFCGLWWTLVGYLEIWCNGCEMAGSEFSGFTEGFTI